MLTGGNTAKLYCLQLLHERAAAGSLSILDLGCGDGRNFVELLRRHPHVRYVGVEPSPAAAAEARRTLPGAEIVNAPAYDLLRDPVDAVVSFSVLEHVVDRTRYFETVAAHVGPGGRVYLNYDSGHFHADAGAVEHGKALASRLLARVGHEARYRKRVRSEEFSALVSGAGLRIVDDKAFNTDLKRLYPHVPEDRRDTFMERWLALELELNEFGIGYREEVFRTRNVLLERG